MKTTITTLISIFLLSITVSAQLRFAKECNKYKTDNTSIAGNDISRGQSSCEMQKTAYLQCLCAVERHNEKLYEERQVAYEEFQRILIRNEEKWNKAELLRNQAHELSATFSDLENGKDYYHRGEDYLLASYTDFEGMFNSRKQSAINKLNEANRILRTMESAYNVCVKMNMGVSENCSLTNERADRQIVYNRGLIQDLYNRRFNKQEDIVLKVNSSPDNSSNSSSVSSNSTVNEGNENEIDPSIKREYNLRNEVNRIEQSGNYVLSAQIKNANPDIYNYEERQATNIAGMVQSFDKIFSSIGNGDGYERRKERDEKWEKEIEENLNERKLEAKKSNRENLSDYEIKSSDNLFGIYDSESDKWVVKPKYREIKFLKKEKGKYIYKAITKSLGNKKIKLDEK